MNKTKKVKKIARDSIFFPFTEPTVKSPITGRKVSGREFSYEKAIKKEFETGNKLFKNWSDAMTAHLKEE